MELSAQVPVTPNPLGPSVGGNLSFDPNAPKDAPLGGLQGVEIAAGVGAEISSSASINGAITVRDVVGGARNLLDKAITRLSNTGASSKDKQTATKQFCTGSRISRESC